jgi:hypothetical protein
VIWSNTAFNLYMRDMLAQEPAASRDASAIMHADILFADASRDRDVVLTNAARVPARGDAVEDEAVDPCGPGSLVARGAGG